MTDESVDDDATLSCAHEPAVGYAVEFVVRYDVDGVESACSMRATVHERELTADDVDAVGCVIPDCENHHERVATELREHAARHSGNVTCDVRER